MVKYFNYLFTLISGNYSTHIITPFCVQFQPFFVRVLEKIEKFYVCIQMKLYD